MVHLKKEIVLELKWGRTLEHVLWSRIFKQSLTRCSEVNTATKVG